MIVSNSGMSLNLPQVLPAMMELDNYYAVELPGYSLEGEEVYGSDIIWFALDTPPGAEWKGKKVKTCRFCAAPRTLTFGQMPGAKFYGPLCMGKDTSGDDQLMTENEEESQNKLGQLLAKAQKASQKE